MKYWIDTEFIEGFHKPLFGKRRHHIDLISIGIVAEDGREYYAISSEYRYHDASDWVKENVILPMFKQQSPPVKQNCDLDNFQHAVGKSNKQIAKEVYNFVSVTMVKSHWGKEYAQSVHDISFYGYYADYDWVVFCSLFGTMMQLPKGFPMYMIDLKQTMDEKVNALSNSDFFTHLTFEEKLKFVKERHTKYPKQENEHNALADARWNKNLYEFLKTF